jgi:hypothetical protein
LRLTGWRYQMIVPQRLTVMRVKRALLRLARTEDAEFVLHPEQLVTTVPFVEAKAWQKRLCGMDEDRRNADRELLLEDCRLSGRSAPFSSRSSAAKR